ncbi:histone-lysine N-methyltransferase Su(var)3-9 [Hyalella azteca]|uniref:Histone-lysine N-methyltransferase Su(Var)3-9 n=1 Tax=Hyalella azteca TaxID=294128 RepID=A0A8B7NIV4_HYAAZ|nr:histone-lysine N-methyltransferase Su(var)3-9 [Hyalella azteca]
MVLPIKFSIMDCENETKKEVDDSFESEKGYNGDSISMSKSESTSKSIYATLSESTDPTVHIENKEELNSTLNNNRVTKLRLLKQSDVGVKHTPTPPPHTSVPNLYSMNGTKSNDEMNHKKIQQEMEAKLESRGELHAGYLEGMIALQKLKVAFENHKAKTFFKPDGVFIRDAGLALNEIESAYKKLAKHFPAVQPTDGEIMDTTPPISDAGNDLGLDDSSSSNKQLSHSLAPPQSFVKENMDSASSSNSQRKSWKRKRQHSLDGPSHQRPRKTRRSLFGRGGGRSGVRNESEGKKSEENEETEKKDEEFEVEKIIDYDRIKGKCRYQVRWKGYGSSDDTWEPLENLTGCEEILLSFIRSRMVERSRITDPEELKTTLLPCEESLKPLLKMAFFAQLTAPAQADVLAALPLVIAGRCKIKEMSELEEDVEKLVSIKDCTSEKYLKAFEELKHQLVLRECKQQRDRQCAELRRWERNMSRVCSDPAPLGVVNDVDLSLPPDDFIYVNDYVASKGINIPQDPVCGCECTDCGSSQNSCCAKQMGSHFAYTKHGRLKVSLGTAIYECNKHCKCTNDCQNRVVQKGRTLQLTIFRTLNRGWGVKAGEFIRSGSFVTEYVGEVISSEEAERRGRVYDARGCTYLFDLDYNKGDLNPYTVDAARCGNVSHFINHSCDPNLVVYNVWINCLDPDLPKLALFAVRDIKKGEEITFDYNSPSSRSQDTAAINDDGSLLASPCVTPGPREIGPRDVATPKTPKRGSANGTTECHCGAANCRRFFF